MRTALCPGSFDPVTKGHIDIIERSAKLFDRIVVVVLVNRDKQCTFSLEERVKLLKLTTEHIPNVTVESYDGLLVNCAQEHGAIAVVKGLRAVTDFEYEFQMALTNKTLNPNVETVFMNTSANYMYLSSSIVKQIASFGGDIKNLVPQSIYEEVKARLSPAEEKV